MGSSWSGFLPQNDIIKLQWAVLEGCQTDVAAKALSALLAKSVETSMPQNADEQDENPWGFEPLPIRDSK